MLCLDILSNKEARLTQDSFSLTAHEKQVAKVAAEKVVPREVVIESQGSEISTLPVVSPSGDTVVTNSPQNKKQIILESTTTSDETTTSAFDPVLEYEMMEAVNNEVSKHKLVKSRTVYEKDTSASTGRRSARGRCKLCKFVFPNVRERRKTPYYCECCTDTNKHPREWFWVCAEHCHAKYLELTKLDVRDKIASERGLSVKAAGAI